MKFILAIALFLMLLPFSSAISAGSNFTLYDGNCARTHLFLEANLTIDNNEIDISDNCLINVSGVDFITYNCTCDSPITFSINILAQNNYSILAKVWDTKGESKNYIPGSSPIRDGGKGGIYYYDPKEKIPIEEDEVNDGLLEEDIPEIVIVEELEENIIDKGDDIKPKIFQEKDSWFKWWYLLILFLLLSLCVGCYLYYKSI